jgi:hypothetical protein
MNSLYLWTNPNLSSYAETSISVADLKFCVLLLELQYEDINRCYLQVFRVLADRPVPCEML